MGIGEDIQAALVEAEGGTARYRGGRLRAMASDRQSGSEIPNRFEASDRMSSPRGPRSPPPPRWVASSPATSSSSARRPPSRGRCSFSAGLPYGTRSSNARTSLPSSNGGRSASTEQDLPDVIAADHADQLGCQAVQEDQHDEPNLDAPEMGPDDLAPEVLVRGPKAPHAPPHRDEVFQVVHEQRRDDVDGCLPNHVIDEGLFGKAVDDRQHVGEEHYLRDEQGGHGRSHRRGQTDAVFLGHQRPFQHNDVERDKEEDRRRKHFVELVLGRRPELAHVSLPRANPDRCSIAVPTSPRNVNADAATRGSVLAALCLLA